MFSKDILIVDIEATGLDVRKHEMIQLAAVLLDKRTLKEKEFFSSYIKPEQWNTRQREAMNVNKIPFAVLKNAPTMKTVLTSFVKQFSPEDVILANYGGVLDITFLRFAFETVKKKYPFDYHILNIWGLCYAYMAKHGSFKNTKKFPGFGLEDFVKKFKLEQQSHDALDDCRLEAEVLRRILKTL